MKVAPPQVAFETIPWLGKAIHAAAPLAHVDSWVAALEPHLIASAITTPRRVAALLGQAAVEAGAALMQLEENLNYTHAARLCAVFPSSFPTVAEAQQYVGDPQRIACKAYATSNGNKESGDGWLFRGSGLLQITGRSQFEAFASSIRAPVDEVADWTRTPDGAAASACWYWRTNKLNPHADAWDLAAVTRAVNGTAKLDQDKRIAAAEAARKAAEGA